MFCCFIYHRVVDSGSAKIDPNYIAHDCLLSVFGGHLQMYSVQPQNRTGAKIRCHTWRAAPTETMKLRMRSCFSHVSKSETRGTHFLFRYLNFQGRPFRCTSGRLRQRNHPPGALPPTKLSIGGTPSVKARWFLIRRRSAIWVRQQCPCRCREWHLDIRRWRGCRGPSCFDEQARASLAALPR